jgi:hypothetical protein
VLAVSVAVTACSGLGAAIVEPALASSTAGASVTATLNAATLSVTVSPSSVTYGSCKDNHGAATAGFLQFPNGTCTAPTPGVISITNGTALADIDVQGAPMVPTGDGNPSDAWSLVANPGSTSVNVYAEAVTGARVQQLTTAAACDTAFGTSCEAPPNQIASERLSLTGPGSSSSNAPKLTTTVTWTAVPPP